MKKSESAKSAKRSKIASETTKGGQDKKNSEDLGKVRGTKNISSIKSVKKRILIPTVKNKEGEAVKTRQGIANVLAKFYEDLYEGEENDTGYGTDSHTEKDERIPDQHVPIPEFTKKMRSKMPSTASKKEKKKTAVEYELNN